MNTLHEKSLILRDIVWLIPLLFLLFGAGIGMRPFITPDEGRYAEIPREMVESGDYVTPHLNYIKYFEKPPLSYWLEAGAIKAFGFSEFSLRIIPAFTALLTCLMVYVAGRKLYGRHTGLLACFILATSALYFGMSRYISTDMPLTAWVTFTLLLFILGECEKSPCKQRYYFWGMYVFTALAVLTKGLIGIVFPGMIVFIWLCITGRWGRLKNYCVPSGILLFLIIAAPWHILVQLKNPEFFHFYFIEQHFLRYLTDYAGREQPFWFFSTVTLVGFFPWVCFLIAGVGHCLKKLRSCTAAKLLLNFFSYMKAYPHTGFLILWPVTLFIFYSLSKSLLLSYALPLMPPLAILLARHFSVYGKNSVDIISRNGFFLLGFLGVITSIISMVFIGVRDWFPGEWLVCAAVSLFIITLCLSSLMYWKKGLYAGVIALTAGMGISFIVADNAFSVLDTRSIKPLAMDIKLLQKGNAEVISYHEYFQDLPAYLGKRVMIARYKGELLFGTQHQDTRDWMLDDASFWQYWGNHSNLFMIMRLSDYEDLVKQGIKPLYPVKQTARNILVTNQQFLLPVHH
jgi:4-amino-4-deoxy-L-arabinose transferase-like glycosyltransferase